MRRPAEARAAELAESCLTHNRHSLPCGTEAEGLECAERFAHRWCVCGGVGWGGTVRERVGSLIVTQQEARRRSVGGRAT